MEKLAGGTKISESGKPQVPTLSCRKNTITMILAVTIASFIIHSGTKGLFNFGRVAFTYAPVDGNGPNALRLMLYGTVFPYYVLIHDVDHVVHHPCS